MSDITGYESGSGLRRKLEETLQLNRDLTRQLDGYRSRERFSDAGLSHLSERQRNMLLATVPEDADSDALRQAAVEVGWQPEAVPSPTSVAPDLRAAQDGALRDAGLHDLSDAQLKAIAGALPEDDTPLTAAVLRDTAHTLGMVSEGYDQFRMADEAARAISDDAFLLSGTTSESPHWPTFEDALNKAGSPEEVKQVIRSQGGRAGVALMDDLD